MLKMEQATAKDYIYTAAFILSLSVLALVKLYYANWLPLETFAAAGFTVVGSVFLAVGLKMYFSDRRQRIMAARNP